MKIITSVEGIGRETALCFIVETRRSQGSRLEKVACPRESPFQYTSGSSVRSVTGSRRANKQVKRLLVPLSITRKKKSELKVYYKRKVEERQKQDDQSSNAKSRATGLARVLPSLEKMIFIP